MVLYWSIKSTFDLIQYGLGAKDSFKGTGVWSFVEFDRQSPNSDEANAESKKPSATSKLPSAGASKSGNSEESKSNR